MNPNPLSVSLSALCLFLCALMLHTATQTNLSCKSTTRNASNLYLRVVVVAVREDIRVAAVAGDSPPLLLWWLTAVGACKTQALTLRVTPAKTTAAVPALFVDITLLAAVWRMYSGRFDRSCDSSQQQQQQQKVVTEDKLYHKGSLKATTRKETQPAQQINATAGTDICCSCCLTFTFDVCHVSSLGSSDDRETQPLLIGQIPRFKNTNISPPTPSPLFLLLFGA